MTKRRTRTLLRLASLALAAAMGACSSNDTPAPVVITHDDGGPVPDSSPPADASPTTKSSLAKEYAPTGSVPTSNGITTVHFYGGSTYSLHRTMGDNADEYLSYEDGTYALNEANGTLTLSPTNGAPQTLPISLQTNATSLVLSFDYNGQSFVAENPTMTPVLIPPHTPQPPDGRPQNGPQLDPPPQPNTDCDGIDVSHHQGVIDWMQVATVKSFAYTKATERKHTDPKFVTNWAGMAAANIARGAYTFLRPKAATDASVPYPTAVAEADYFADLLTTNGYDSANDLPPVLDIEVDNGASVDDVVGSAHAFLDEITLKLGVTATVYTNPLFWKNTLKSPDFSAYPLWIANYTSKTTPTVPAAWTTQSIWQWSEQGASVGVTGNVDLDLWNSDVVGGPSACGGPITAKSLEGMQVTVQAVPGEFAKSTMTLTKVTAVVSVAQYQANHLNEAGGLSGTVPMNAQIFTFLDNVQPAGVMGFPSVFGASNFANRNGRSNLIAVWPDSVDPKKNQWVLNISGGSYTTGGGFPQWHEYQFVYDSRMSANPHNRYDVYLGQNAMGSGFTFIRTAKTLVTTAKRPGSLLWFP